MILNTSYHNPEHIRLINELVGKEYSFFEKIKLGGIGSKRMIIENVSPNLDFVINTGSDLNYSNIELRPNGILVMINKGLTTFTWIIPFYHLVLYKTNGISIHAQGKFIHFRNNFMFKNNKNFFDKLLNEKVKYDTKFEIQHN